MALVSICARERERETETETETEKEKEKEEEEEEEREREGGHASGGREGVSEQAREYIVGDAVTLFAFSAACRKLKLVTSNYLQ